RPDDSDLRRGQRSWCRPQAGHQVPQRRTQPEAHPRRDRCGEHQLRGGLLPGRRHHRPQVRGPPHVPVRTVRHSACRAAGPRRIGRVLATLTEMPPGEHNRQRGYHALHAMLNLYGPGGRIHFDTDREAARAYFLQHVNPNTVFFHSLREKMDYLVENDYYEQGVLDQYDFSFIESLSEQAYAKKFRFPTFLGAFKYYTSYTLKTFDGERYLERFE